jgi:hypothetical protein|tara:strand:- start:366 stop:485 length:120 start_codon:yes stop_codon:yes gene_type:complete
MEKKKSAVKKVKAKTPKVKKKVTYQHWNGEGYEQRSREI